MPLRAVSRFFAGMRMLGRGLGLWATSPKLMLLGAIPALVVGAVLLGGFVVLAVNIGGVVAWLTPFADEWSEPLQLTLRVLAGLVTLVATAYFSLRMFTTLTLAVGGPFYERIWRAVELRDGSPAPQPEESAWRAFVRGLGNSIRFLALTVVSSVLLFACGFIPVVGQVLAPVLAALFGGWLLTVELAGFAFDARGYTLRERRRMLAADRAGALGFGVAAYLLFLVPLGAVLVMPAAVAGATMLAREALDAPS